MEYTAKAKKSTRFLNVVLLGAIIVVELVLIRIVFFAFGHGEGVYNNIAIGLICLWLGILIPYYVWAIYFYNINMGQTNEDWAAFRDKSTHYPDSDAEPPATKNPNERGSLGLPQGTIRGTIALTVTIGAMAMLIASFDMDNTLKSNSFFVDNREFFKTSFLMVIAFYFGTRGIEQILQNPVKSGTQVSGNDVENAEDAEKNKNLKDLGAVGPKGVDNNHAANTKNRHALGSQVSNRVIASDFEDANAKG